MNDELSAREHADMRDVVMAGAQRIRPAGRHRTRIVAAAIALVLVGGVTGGAVTTAALLGAEQTPAPAESRTPTPTTTAPTPTPTVSPTPTPEEPPAPVTGVMPFGGECANTLTDEEVDALRGVGMSLSDYRWETGANTVLGGIDCVWVSEEAYLSATLHLYAFPEGVVPDGVRAAAVDGCRSLEGAGNLVECSSTEVVEGMWMLVRATGPADQISQEGVDSLLRSASGRLADHAPGVAAAPTPDWWAAPDCAGIAAAIDPATYGFERVALLEQQSTIGSDRPEAISFLAGAAYGCDLHFTSGSGENTSGEVVTVTLVPGGAVAFPTAVEAEHSQPVDVAGAQAAVIVPGLDRYEGSNAMIVVTDGVNVLMVTPDMTRATADAAGLAAALLALMHP